MRDRPRQAGSIGSRACCWWWWWWRCGDGDGDGRALLFLPPLQNPKILLPLGGGHLPPKPISLSLSHTHTHSHSLSLRCIRQSGMQGISKLAVGSAMVVALCLFLVFVLLLMLYIELCCSSLWRWRWRRQFQIPLPTMAASGGGSAPSAKIQKKSQGDNEVSTAASDEQKGGSPGFSPLQKPAVSPTAAAYYAHGVLQTPANFFTAVPHAAALEAATKQGEMLGNKDMALPGSKASLHFIGLIPSPRSATRRGAACDSGSSCCTPEEHFVCISNPIYDGACSSTAAADDDDGGSTPFKTPDTSPSRLEMEDGGDDDEEEEQGEMVEELERGERSPALKPMKKLPPALPLGTPAACLADGRRSLATSISVTDTNRPSSSSSNSLGTSPSW